MTASPALYKLMSAPAVRAGLLHNAEHGEAKVFCLLGAQMKAEEGQLREMLSIRRAAHNAAAEQLQASLQVLQKVKPCGSC